MKKITFLLLIISFPVFCFDYSINLMWIYLNKEKATGSFVFPEKFNDKNTLDQVIAWAKNNPAASVNLWYDSEFVTKGQIEKSKEKFNEVNKSLNRTSKYSLNLLDVRALPGVEGKAFSTAVPVYFRADLLRLKATLDAIKECTEECYFIYADLDVVPMDKNQLFDEKTKNLLNKFGIVMAFANTSQITTLNYENEYPTNSVGFENLFHIVGNNKPKLFQALNWFIEKETKAASWPNKQYKVDAQEVFSDFPKMFDYFYALEGWLKPMELSTGHKEIISNTLAPSMPYPGTLEKFMDEEDFYINHIGKREEDQSGNSWKMWLEPTKNNEDLVNKKSRVTIFIPTKKVDAPKVKGSGYY